MATRPTAEMALSAGHELHDPKRVVRQRTLAARDALAPQFRRAAGAAIAERVVGLPSFHDARTVLLTLPFKSEWNTRPILDRALAMAKTVLLPRVDRDQRMLVLHAVRDIDRDVMAGYAGIPEPREDCRVIAPQEVDWVLVPGVAFDSEGRRLGYGGGFYDRLLPLLAPAATRVAGVFDLQIVDRVPAAPHDLPVHAIVTETRTLLI